MQLASLDLNMLVALDALLEEVSVTRAAQRLHLSQPALSASLGKLRRHFGDDLLRRVGNNYELTPLAVQLKQSTRLALESIERVFIAEPEFDPSTSEREFTLLASDYAMSVVGREASILIHERGPRLRLRIRQHSTTVVDNATEGLRSVDGILLPHGFINGLPHTDIHTDSYMVMVATSNSRIGDSITMTDLAELPWVVTYHGPTAFTPATRQLQMLGVEPHIQVVVESFVALPSMIAGTDRVALVQRKLTPRLIAQGDVRVLPCPFEAVPLRQALWWHPMYARDPAHIWLRQVLTEAGQIIDASEGPFARTDTAPVPV